MESPSNNMHAKGKGKLGEEGFVSLLETSILENFRMPSNNSPADQHDLKRKERVRKDSRQVLEQKLHKLESLLHFYSELHRQSGDWRRIDVKKKITRKIFYNKYYLQNKPVVLKGLLDNCPALKKWSPDFFRRNFYSAPVELTANRDNDSEYEKNFTHTVTTTTMGNFVEFMALNPETNNVYIVARNYFFSNPHFQSLKEDLKPPPEIVDTSSQGQNDVKLWFGPKGTVTPLHHDKHSILFAQVYGRKHFKMIPSYELGKVYCKDRYYSSVDPENIDSEKYPDFLEASLVDVILTPGDLLFIPAGWWHWVKSLDISISVTFSSFHVKNHNTEWKC